MPVYIYFCLVKGKAFQFRRCLVRLYCTTLSNIIKHRLHVHFCLLASDPELLALTFTAASQSLRHPSIHYPSYPYKECPPSRFSGAPSVSVCLGRRDPGLRSTESKLDFTELCHVSAVLFDCNIVKLPIELLQNVAPVLRIMYFLFKSILLGKMIILCNVNHQLVHYYYQLRFGQ